MVYHSMEWSLMVYHFQGSSLCSWGLAERPGARDEPGALCQKEMSGGSGVKLVLSLLPFHGPGVICGAAVTCAVNEFGQENSFGRIGELQWGQGRRKMLLKAFLNGWNS